MPLPECATYIHTYIHAQGSHSCLQKIPGLTGTPTTFFQLFCRPAVFKYTHKQQLFTLYIQCNNTIQCKTFIEETVRLIMSQEYFVHLFTHGVLYRKQFFSSSSYFEPQVNSSTFQNLEVEFRKLSSTKFILQDFPGPRNFRNKNPGLLRISQEEWEPCLPD